MVGQPFQSNTSLYDIDKQKTVSTGFRKRSIRTKKISRISSDHKIKTIRWSKIIAHGLRTEEHRAAEDIEEKVKAEGTERVQGKERCDEVEVDINKAEVVCLSGEIEVNPEQKDTNEEQEESDESIINVQH